VDHSSKRWRRSKSLRQLGQSPTCHAAKWPHCTALVDLRNGVTPKFKLEARPARLADRNSFTEYRHLAATPDLEFIP
jgi:hypothetical protein